MREETFLSSLDLCLASLAKSLQLRTQKVDNCLRGTHIVFIQLVSVSVKPWNTEDQEVKVAFGLILCSLKHTSVKRHIKKFDLLTSL